jgi:hypothetical protein
VACTELGTALSSLYGGLHFVDCLSLGGKNDVRLLAGFMRLCLTH